MAGVKVGRVHLCRVADNICDPIWQVTLRSSAMVSNPIQSNPCAIHTFMLPTAAVVFTDRMAADALILPNQQYHTTKAFYSEN